jgi:hypothetical protein
VNARKFRGIGNLVVRNSRVVANLPGRRFAPGVTVSMEMFWGDRIHQNTFRGPFNNSKDWLRARLGIKIKEYEKRLESETEDDDKMILKKPYLWLRTCWTRVNFLPGGR